MTTANTSTKLMTARPSSLVSTLLPAALLSVLCAGCPLQVPGEEAVFVATGLRLTPSATSAVAGTAITVSAAAVGAGEITQPAATTVWTATGNCSVSPGTGAQVSVSAAGATSCFVNANFSGFTASVTLTFTAGPTVATLTLAGPASINLGDTQTYTATAKDSSGATIAVTTGLNWSVDGTLFSVTAGAGTSTATVKAIGAGTGNVSVSIGAISATPVSVHAVATGVRITPSVQSANVGTAISVSAISTGAASATGLATKTTWAVTGANCSVSPQTGATVSVSATAAATCVLTATLDTTLTANTTLTFTAVVVPASLTVAGADILDVHAAASTYTATVKDAGGNVIPNATVTWSSPGGQVLTLTPNGLTTGLVANAVGALTLQASVSGLNPVTKSITVNPAALAVTPATVNIVQSPNKSTLFVGHATLQAKDAGGTVVPFVANLQFGSGLSETHTPNDTNFNFLSTTLNGDGTVALTFYDLSAPGTSHTATLVGPNGKSAALTVGVVAPDAVTLALKPGDSAAVGSNMTVTPSVTVGANAVDGAPVTLTVGGDAIFTAGTVPASVTAPNNFSPQIAHLGKATITPVSLGKTGTAVTIYGVPASIGGFNGPFALSTVTPLALQQGTPVSVVFSLRSQTNTPIDLTAEGAKGGAIAGSMVPATGAPASASCTLTGTLNCTLNATAAGTATLHVVWTSQDAAKTVTADFPLSATAAAAPVFPSGTFAATWTGPLDYTFSFPVADAASGAVIYDLYASSAANADTDDNVLFTAGNKTAGITTTGAGPLAAAFTAGSGAFSSRWAFGIKAHTAVSTDSVAKRFTLQTQAASGLPSVPFLAGRTVFEVSLAGVVKPLFTVGAFAATPQLERTAPRWSPLDGSTFGLVGVLLNGQTQQLYARAAASTSLAATPVGAAIQTDAASCSSSALIRPTTAIDVLQNGAAVAAFTVTPQFHSCDSAQLIAVGATGAQELAGHYVDQVAQLGANKLVLTDRGSLTLLDLSGASAVETQVSSAKLTAGAVIAAAPAPGGSGTATVYTLDATNGLRSYDLSGALPATAATVSDAATVFTGAFAAAGTPVRMIAVEPTHVVVECVASGAHTLWALATAAGAPAPVKLVDATVILDPPTLGSSQAAGH
jgi:adhesin/invasin